MWALPPALQNHNAFQCRYCNPEHYDASQHSREHISPAAQILCDLLAEPEMSDSAAEPINPTTNVINVSHSWQGRATLSNRDPKVHI